MNRAITTAIVLLFAGMALAGCTGNNNGGGTTTTTVSAGAPQAVVTASPLSPKVGDPVTFTATQALASDSVAWEFGDGAKATGATATHPYAHPGSYIVLLTVTRGTQTVTNDAALTYVTVTEPEVDIANITNSTAPFVQAAASQQVVQTGTEIKFDANGSGAWTANPDFDPKDPVQTASHNAPFKTSAEGLNVTWNFGGDGTATGFTATHAFSKAGLYAVMATGTGTAGNSSFVTTVRVLPTAPPTPGVRNPTTFLEASISGPESLDPGYDYETAGGQVIQQVYETLFFYNRDHSDQLVPRLATEIPTKENGGISADGLTLTIKLRSGVKFHNGETMTADDVKFSIDRLILMDDPDGPAETVMPFVKGAPEYYGSDKKAADRDAYIAAGGLTVVDPATIKLQLAQPDPAILFRLAFSSGSVVSKKGACAHAESDYVACVPPPGVTRHPWMDTHEVGSGPFQLDAWIPGQQVILKRFDNYWGTKPTLEKVIIQQVDDVNTRLLMLFSGQADDVYVGIDHDTDVANKDGIRVVDQPSFTISFVGLNEAYCGGPANKNFQSCMATNGQDAPKGANGQVDPLFFSDLHMRKAWVYAFDYDSYYNNIARGHGKMANGPIPKGMFGYDDSIPTVKRNVDLAVTELKASNHSDGFSFTLYFNTGNTVREKASNLLAQNVMEVCQKAGATCDLKVQGLDFSTAFLPKQRAKALPIFFLGWAPDYAYPDDYTVTFLHSTKGVYAKRVSYHNPAVDELQDKLLKETDQAKLQSGYSDLVKTANADFPFIWLAQAANYHVERTWVQGYYYNQMHNGGPNIGDFATISKK